MKVQQRLVTVAVEEFWGWMGLGGGMGDLVAGGSRMGAIPKKFQTQAYGSVAGAGSAQIRPHSVEL